MAKNGNWKSLVPEEVADYLEKNGLVTRFRKEFGLATLALALDSNGYKLPETLDEEKLHTLEA